MSDSPRAYVPADAVCLSLGIGLSFAVGFILWLLLGTPFGFALLALGVLAAVAGMLLSGVCARSRERDLLGLGRRLGLRAEGKAPAGAADDPMRRMEQDRARTSAPGDSERGRAPGDDANA